MKVLGLIDEDFVNYKLPSMYIIMPYCDFKCDRECGRPICQNSALAHEPTIEIGTQKLIDRYEQNLISKAIVFAGLEPFDSQEDLQTFLMLFRYNHNDDVIIYTGYTEKEVKEKFNWVFLYENIIIKFGRFIPDQESHYDEVLGVKLASPNQYAKRYK